MTEIVASEVMTAAAHSVTMEGVREAMSAQCMATPPMTHARPATMGKAVTASMESAASTVKSGKPTMKSTASAVKPTTSTVKPTASTVTAGDCRGVRHNAKCADCDTRC